MLKGLLLKGMAISLVLSLLIVGLFGGVYVPSAHAAVQYTFYASPSGSGTTCSLASPCSLTGARDKVRTVNSGMSGDIEVILRGGKYYLSSTLTFNENDSGKNGYRVYWKNYTGETPDLIGGQLITGWTLDSGNVYKANVGTSLNFHTLFENGVRANKARYPNTGYLQDENGSGGIGEATYLDAWLTFKSGDIPNWSDIVGGEVNIWGYWDWHNSTLPITGFNYSTRKITLSRPPMWGTVNPNTTPYGFKQNNYDRYFIQGVKSALDTAGEFYLNTSTGYLYYYPRNTPIASQEIIAPTVKNIIEFIGSSTTSLVQNIQFQGIKVRVSDFTNTLDPWADPANPMVRGAGGAGAQYENNEPLANRYGNIYMRNAANITLHTLDISNSGYNGVMLDRYVQKVAVFNSQIHDIGYTGVFLSGGTNNLTDTLISRDNLIQNNHIYDIGKLAGNGVGVSIEQSAYNNVNHNEIHNGPRHGINILGSYDNSSSVNLASNNLINYNRLYNLNNDSSDTGNVYQFAAGKYNVYDHNFSYDSNSIHSVNAVYYLDNHTDYATLSNNIGYDPAIINRNDNFPTITLMNNVLSSNSADWTAAGLDSSQMGIVTMANPVWPAVPVNLPYTDDFENGTIGQTAANWTTAYGTWQIVSGKAYYSSGGVGAGGLTTVGDATWSNYTAKAKVKVASWNTTSYRSVGILGRYQDASNYYYFQYYNNDGKLYLSKFVNGVWTHLGSTPFTFNTNQYYEFKLDLNGSSIKASVDGTQIFSVTDSQFSAGKFGMLANENAATFDDVGISAISLPFSDDFEGETVGTIASKWSNVFGSWQVIAGKAYNSTGGVGVGGQTVVGDSTWSNYTAEAKVKVASWNTTSYRSVGLLTRYQDSSNYYYFQYYNNDGKLYISKFVNGVWTHLNSVAFTFNTNQYYTFKVVLSGSSIQCYVDGTLKFSVTDSQFASGKVGLHANENAAIFDDVSIY
ncbi:right-handed parallel beta-helix repeat-containing protein [Paenibacillus sp. CF384]|uniref:right-handed parallel beta-helix repeat-containing protein n=1 Tax=Paenibacillus sp. CF384 TaxID=1884382 RepID=UPI000897EF2C|nr:right-handed parallel beta-helix repeat-containing protein [Paenibacillus sp. CF384]SDW66126.1 Right handed beta helix region [Paenibacillus sp. CF384]